MKKPTMSLRSLPTQREEGEDAGLTGALEMPGSSEMVLFLMVTVTDSQGAREQPEAISNL